MRPPGPTFWRIGGLNGWLERTDSAATDLAVSDERGLRLTAKPGGILSLISKDESLGGLALPRGMAFDRSLALYLLDSDAARIKRWDAERQSFVELPEVGGVGAEPRQIRNATSIAIARNWLYVADVGNQRVQIFDVRTLVLEKILSVAGWSPVDIAAAGNTVYILDQE